jgi:hypothetical protein
MKYSMQFPDEILMMPYIGNGERDTYRTYLKERVAEIFKVNYLTAFKMVSGHAFVADSTGPIVKFCEENFGKLIEVKEDQGNTA